MCFTTRASRILFQLLRTEREHDEQLRAIRSLTEGRSGSGKLMYRILCRRLESETTRRDALAQWINTASQRLVQRHLQGMLETCNMDNRSGGFELVVPPFLFFPDGSILARVPRDHRFCVNLSEDDTLAPSTETGSKEVKRKSRKTRNPRDIDGWIRSCFRWQLRPLWLLQFADNVDVVATTSPSVWTNAPHELRLRAVKSSKVTRVTAQSLRKMLELHSPCSTQNSKEIDNKNSRRQHRALSYSLEMDPATQRSLEHAKEKDESREGPFEWLP